MTTVDGDGRRWTGDGGRLHTDKALRPESGRAESSSAEVAVLSGAVGVWLARGPARWQVVFIAR